MFNLARILGPSAGGLVIAVVGIAGCFFVNALSFLALIVTLLCMELPAWVGAPYVTFVPVFATNILRVGYGLLMSASGVGAMVAAGAAA